jgi:putative cardiolipin synthase
MENDESGVARLVWITETDGKEVRYYSDPEVGVWRRFTTWLVSLLPIEHHL